MFFLLLGFVLASMLFITLWRLIFQPHRPKKELAVYSSIEQLRSVGELVAFKMISKEIVTTSQHWLGEIGKKYFQWFLSTKKMAMIFEFDIEFRYNLRSPDFKIEQVRGNNYLLKMPPCLYQIHIRDINFYDEQNSKLLPWLLPDLLNRAFGMGFNESDKNQLKEEAKNQAAKLAEEIVKDLQPEVEKSAYHTLLALANNLGVEKIAIDFSQSKIMSAITYSNGLEKKIKQIRGNSSKLLNGKER